MARINLSDAPYYDDTDMSKQYYQLLARPGRVAQAREFTAMQTVLREIIKSVGDSILKNGDVIEGCQVIIHGTSVRVTSGKVYIEGIVMPVEESIVAIRAQGTETIGVKLMEVVVDENSDHTLRDPAQGYDNYNQPGCVRLKRYLQVVANDPESAVIATLYDGAIMVESVTPTYDTLTQMLARRTYDESGSYIVEGLNSRTEDLNTVQYNLVVEPGKAYVLGYELKIPTARRIPVDRSTTFNKVTSNFNLYRDDTQEYMLDSNPHVKEIVSVNGQVSKTVNQSINTNLDGVLLPDADVVQVVSVSQGDTNYTVGTTSDNGDCYLTRSGNTYILKWNGTDNYPTPGSTYTVVYKYNKYFVDGVDYELALIGSSHYLRWKDADKPLNETMFSIVYNQYLSRKDIVYIDRYGEISVMKGVPTEYGFEVLPTAPLNTLTLAHIYNPPNGTVIGTNSSYAIEVSNVGLTRFTMNDIQNLLDRVKTIEYDQAVLSLNDEARNVETASDKKGLFTDPLIDVSRVDFFYNIDSTTGEKIDTSKPIYDMAFDLAVNICYLPIVSHSYTPEYDTENSTTQKYGRLYTIRSTGEEVVLSQMNATKSFQVNPYSMFPQMPEVSVTPSVDNWIDITTISIPVSVNNTSTTERVVTNTRHVELNRPSDSIFRDRNYSVTSSKSTSVSTNVTTSSIGVKTTSYTTTNTVDTDITYIRQRLLSIEGKDFPSNLDNISCYFDGVRVDLTPGDGTSAGTRAGTVRADESGYVKASFMIPSGVVCGAREVTLKSDLAIDGMVTEGFTLYTASGINRRIENTITTVKTVLMERVVTNTVTETTNYRTVYVDPVGQTFVLDKMTLLKGIDLYFESKTSTNTPIICEIREVVNGSIASTIYAHKSLPSYQVNVSNDASVATRFNFDDPVLLEGSKEYAFVVRSTSDQYRIWVSELGGADVQTGGIVLKNSYMSGVMFSSSNNSTWTAHQTTDVKFRLVSDTYASNSVMNMKEIAVDEAARLYMTADTVIPQGTSIDWSYSLDGTNYLPITPYNITLLNSIQSKVSLRATLQKTEDSILSPIIALDTIELVTSRFDLEGHYISKNVTGLDPYTTAKIVVDVYEPAGTSLKFFISKDNGNTLLEATRSSTTMQSYGWNEITLDATVDSSTQFRVFVKADSVNKFMTPAFRRLRCIMS